MSAMHLFIDGSLDPKSKIGIGACLLLTSDQITQIKEHNNIHFRTFRQTTSNKLELQTLLWALKRYQDKAEEFIIYTDSQTVITLPARIERIKKNNFRSKAGRLLNNHREYLEFFKEIKSTKHSFVKIKGHQRSKDKSLIDHIFSQVDKAARKKLRLLIVSFKEGQ